MQCEANSRLGVDAITAEFTDWFSWEERSGIGNLGLPGVYAIAMSDAPINAKRFSWLKEIIYVGMTNSRGGLKARLDQFDRGMHGKDGHGGALRFYFKHRDYECVKKQLYVAVRKFDCDVTSGSPKDLIAMGDVARFEYLCIAAYVSEYSWLPEFNDKERSEKYSTGKQ